MEQQSLANCAEYQQHYNCIQPTFHRMINAVQFTVKRQEISTSDRKFIIKNCHARIISLNCFNGVIIQSVNKMGIRGAEPKPHMQCFLQHT